MIYKFDLRSSETGTYLREYFDYPVEVVSAFKSISHKVENDKITFTIITEDGYNRVKIVLKNDLKHLVAFTSKYTVNTDGNYVWTIEIDAPTETTIYAFDLRLNESGAYTKAYRYYEI